MLRIYLLTIVIGKTRKLVLPLLTFWLEVIKNCSYLLTQGNILLCLYFTLTEENGLPYIDESASLQPQTFPDPASPPYVLLAP